VRCDPGGVESFPFSTDAVPLFTLDAKTVLVGHFAYEQTNSELRR